MYAAWTSCVCGEGNLLEIVSTWLYFFDNAAWAFCFEKELGGDTIGCVGLHLFLDDNNVTNLEGALCFVFVAEILVSLFTVVVDNL